MTAETSGVRVTKNVGVVTVFAFRLGVFTQQREACQAVVKEYILLPRRLVVAFGADQAESTLVRIIICVTRQTIGLQCELVYRFDVARSALRLCMSAMQCMSCI